VRRSLLPLLFAIAIPLALPAVAGAGGFATAGLSSTPEGTAPGKPWTVDITILQHGRTPLDGLSPRVQISSGDSIREFAAKPTGEAGVYRAAVVFPTAGRWEYTVLDGFNDQMPHTFPAVRIGDGAASPAAPSPADPEPAPAQAPAPPSDDGIAAGWLWGAGAALLLALIVLAADRLRRRPGRAPRGAEPA
jgi:hypothetical protein